MNASSESKAFDGAVLIAGTTAIAYGVAFSYERAFLGYFGVPEYLVEVELRGLLLAIFALSGFAVLIQSVLMIWSWRISPGLLLAVARFVVVAFLVYLAGAWLRVDRFGWLLVSVPAIGWLLLEFVTPLKLYPTKSTYVEKLDAGAVDDAKRENAYSWIMRKLGRKLEVALSVAVVTMFAGHQLGEFQASRMRDFLVRDNCIVLQVRQDLALCSELHDQSLVGKVRYVPAIGNEMVLMRIGPIARFNLRQLDATERTTRTPVEVSPDAEDRP